MTTTPATTTSTVSQTLNPSTNRVPPSVVGGSSDAVTTLQLSGGGCGEHVCTYMDELQHWKFASPLNNRITFNACMIVLL